MQFEFSTASRIIFGPGKLNSIGGLVREFGHKALIVSGSPQAISDRLINLLEAADINHSFVRVKTEPTIDAITELVGECQRAKPAVLIGIGGGSAIDSVKATAALVTNPGDITDYLEVIGRNQPLRNPALPVIAIPTTAGTGSEVTRNAVLGSSAQHIKVSLRSPYLLPRFALVDPELTISVPPATTASTGLDALTQLIEPFTSNIPNPITDALCREGIRRISHSFFTAFDLGSDPNARQDMSLASLLSGLAMANSRLGAVHGLAGPLGGEISAPHGAICACLLPYVMVTNLAALKERAPGHPALERYQVIAELLSGEAGVSAETGIAWIRDFRRHTHVLQLSAFGLNETQFERIIEKALISSSMKGNPITLSEVELRSILQECL